MKNNEIGGWGAHGCAPGADRLVSKKEAADILGVSVRTVEREISAGNLAKHAVRGAVRVSFVGVLRLAGLLNLNPSHS
jgi:excisionase family DNA binding protein